MTRVLVTGGRYYADRRTLVDVLDALHRERPVSLLIQGGARGADQLARQWAAARTVACQTYNAKWDDIDAPKAIIKTGRNGEPYNARAGIDRNVDMLARGNPEVVVVFPGNRGTSHMFDIADRERRRGAALEIRDYRKPGGPVVLMPAESLLT